MRKPPTQFTANHRVHDRFRRRGRFGGDLQRRDVFDCPAVRIVDLTHEVTPFSILRRRAISLWHHAIFPAGTVFVVVIDPTVGSTRKAIVVKSKRDQYFVLPDNGLMTLVQDRDGLEAAREITNPSVDDWICTYLPRFMDAIFFAGRRPSSPRRRLESKSGRN